MTWCRLASSLVSSTSLARALLRPVRRISRPGYRSVSRRRTAVTSSRTRHRHARPQEFVGGEHLTVHHAVIINPAMAACQDGIPAVDSLPVKRLCTPGKSPPSAGFLPFGRLQIFSGVTDMNEIQMLIGGEAAAHRTALAPQPARPRVATHAPAATVDDARLPMMRCGLPGLGRHGSARRALLMKAQVEAKGEAFAVADGDRNRAWYLGRLQRASGGRHAARSRGADDADRRPKVISRPTCRATLALAVRQPAGVVLGIAPWNAVILGVRHLDPGLRQHRDPQRVPSSVRPPMA